MHRNIIGNLKITHIDDSFLEQSDSLFNLDLIKYFTIPIPPQDTPLNLECDNDTTFNLLFIKQVYPCYMQRKVLLSQFYYNAWIIQIKDNESITAKYVIKTIIFFCDNSLYELALGLIK